MQTESAPETGTVLCGPSGWSHVHPAGKQHALEYVAGHFDAVEIPDTFNGFVRPEAARVWLKKTSANPRFLFTAKLHKQFTHDRKLESSEISAFKEGLWPLMRAGKLGCVLMQFPWAFRYTRENRDHLIRLRRTFHEFPLAAEMRHSSWMTEEAVGTFIDYRIAFCNIDQPAYTKSMPPTAFLTSANGFVRLHGRNAFGWFGGNRAHRYDYLYSANELADWKGKIERFAGFAAKTFVIFNNDQGGKALINALQMQSMLRGGDGRDVPPELLRRYPQRAQTPLFTGFSGQAVA